MKTWRCCFDSAKPAFALGIPLLAAAAPLASVPKGFASIAQHELERGGNFAFSTTAASTATASTAELQLRSGSQYVGGSCG